MDVFTYTKLIIPVNTGDHWCLAVADFTTSELRWYDSLGGDGRSKLEEIWLAIASNSYRIDCLYLITNNAL